MSTELTVTDARERFSEVVETAEREPVFLTKHGRRQAVVLSAAQYDRMLELVEDAEDLADSDAAMAAIVAGAPTIPWEDVKRDLGLA
ncbi:MAG: type II toxin-antitoxin system prevent-host-death family antitoxin [Actinomycetia bacterium]|nr:type II toxin-antitoxin system prevent-host-death family antitoxin [Actinomycetes bacterium]